MNDGHKGHILYFTVMLSTFSTLTHHCPPPLFLVHSKLWLTPERGKSKGKVLDELRENTLQAPTTAIGPAFILYWGHALPPLVPLAHLHLSHHQMPRLKADVRREHTRRFIEVAPSLGAVPVRAGVTGSTGVVATDGASWPASETVLSPSPLASRKWDGGWGCFTTFLAAGKRAAPWI